MTETSCFVVFYEGIRIQNLQPGQITMDIDFRWGGDPSIILAVDALVASLPIQVLVVSLFFAMSNFAEVNLSLMTGCNIFLPTILQLKDLQVFTIVRVVFQLSEEIPCISAVVVALLAEARIY